LLHLRHVGHRARQFPEKPGVFLIQVKVARAQEAHVGPVKKGTGIPMRTTISVIAITAAMAAAGTASAQQAGTWSFGVGIGMVQPQDNTGVLAGATTEIDSNAQPTFTAEYFIADNLGIELLAATPFEHTVTHATLGDIATAVHLPPTISLNYHIPTGGPLTPFIGAGINYTRFLDVDGVGALAGAAVEVEDSWGLALHAGVDYALSDTSALRFDLRWIDIDADVTVGGVTVGTAEIDPVVFGISYVFQF
jgi:outer membrane protein